MKRLVLPVPLIALFFFCLSAANAQHTYDSLGGFGNVVYPGTGHAPNAAFLNNGHAGGGGAYRGNGAVGHTGAHPRTVIVPYPIYYGNYYDPSQYNQQQAPPDQTAQTAPSVVINQTFVPERPVPVVQDYTSPEAGMRLYPGPPGPYQQMDAEAERRAAAASEEPTIYLIAFKDHTIVEALGYWMEGGVLHYVSAEHSLNQASLDLLDRPLSQRLNDERNVAFKLPAQ